MAFPAPKMEGVPTPSSICEFATKMAAQLKCTMADGLSSSAAAGGVVAEPAKLPLE